MTYEEWRAEYETRRLELIRGSEAAFGSTLYELRANLLVPTEMEPGYRQGVKLAMRDFLGRYGDALKDHIGWTARFELEGGRLAGQGYAKVVGADFTAELERAFSTGIDHTLITWDRWRAMDATKLTSIPEQVISDAMSRRLPSGLNLSERVWDLGRYERDIYEIVNRGILERLSPESIAAQLDGFVLPGRHVTTTTPYGRSLNYDAMRLARTEVGRAYRQTADLIARQSPWITGETWHLSLEHPDLGCQCEDYDGVTYPPGEVPSEPHPQCLCYTEYELVSDAEWEAAWDSYMTGGPDELGIGEWMAD